LDEGFGDDSVFVKIHECEVGVARDIIRESNNGYRAVVVGRKGMSRLMDIMMGSIAHKLMEKLSNIPVWLVGGTPWPGKLLLGLDPSPGAMRSVDHVGDILGGTDTDVALLNVVRAPNLFIPEIDDLAPDKQRDLYDQAKEKMTPVFDNATNILTKAGFNQKQITTNLISGVGSRAGTIVEEAKREGCGTIVIGRRGITTVEDFFMGRVSNKVINLARDMAVWIVN
jgi:nucleotide-binding universal stress UspA family protein